MRFLCGPRRPTDADQALIDEFGSWLQARAQRPRMVTRPQDCDCGASQVAMVAHGVNCKGRSRRTPLATGTPQVCAELAAGSRCPGCTGCPRPDDDDYPR